MRAHTHTHTSAHGPPQAVLSSALPARWLQFRLRCHDVTLIDPGSGKGQRKIGGGDALARAQGRWEGESARDHTLFQGGNTDSRTEIVTLQGGYTSKHSCAVV